MANRHMPTDSTVNSRLNLLQASASDADSSQARATPDTLALMCAGEAVSPESSDDEDRDGAGQQQQPPCSNGPLQPVPGATLAIAPAAGLYTVSLISLYTAK